MIGHIENLFISFSYYTIQLFKSSYLVQLIVAQHLSLPKTLSVLFI